MDGRSDRANLDRYVGAYCHWARLRPVGDADLVARLVFATDGSLGRSLEMTLAAIRRVLLAGRDALALEDFAWVFERQATPGGINPFDIPDWKGTSASLPPRSLGF